MGDAVLFTEYSGAGPPEPLFTDRDHDRVLAKRFRRRFGGWCGGNYLETSTPSGPSCEGKMGNCVAVSLSCADVTGMERPLNPLDHHSLFAAAGRIELALAVYRPNRAFDACGE
jgi:hypothetical protein